MPSARLDHLLSNNRLKPLLPVLYIAWTDTELAESECARIRELADALPEFDDEARQTLDWWLRPDNSPTATELAVLRRRIREQVGKGQTPLAGLSACMCADVSAEVGAAVAAYEQERNISGVGVSAVIFRDTGQPVPQAFGRSHYSFDPAALQAVLEGEYADEWALVRKTLAAECSRRRQLMTPIPNSS